MNNAVMNIDMNTARLLGAAQLIVFVASVLSERLLASVVGSGSISDILVNISKNVTLMRISNLLALVDSLAIVLLGVLFYIVFNKQYEIIALVALGFFLVEAITLAISKIGAFALIPLSQEFVAAGAPGPSYFQALGDFLFHGVDRQGYHIHNLFFCLGGILWYYLFLKSGYIPQALSLWGLVAVSLLLIPVLLQLYDRDFTHPLMVVGLLYLPFELFRVIGSCRGETRIWGLWACGARPQPPNPDLSTPYPIEPLFLGVWLIVKGFN